MERLKRSPEPFVVYGLLRLFGATTPQILELALNIFGRKATAVMTNVPGPRERLKFLGATLQDCMFWVPQSGDIGMGVSILSYDGAVQFGLITDRGLVPDPERVIERFAPEFEKLVLTTLLVPPWHGDLDPALAARAIAT